MLNQVQWKVICKLLIQWTWINNSQINVSQEFSKQPISFHLKPYYGLSISSSRKCWIGKTKIKQAILLTCQEGQSNSKREKCVWRCINTLFSAITSNLRTKEGGPWTEICALRAWIWLDYIALHRARSPQGQVDVLVATQSSCSLLLGHFLITWDLKPTSRTWTGFFSGPSSKVWTALHLGQRCGQLGTIWGDVARDWTSDWGVLTHEQKVPQGIKREAWTN